MKNKLLARLGLATLYFLPGTTFWGGIGTTWGVPGGGTGFIEGCVVHLWNPLIQTSDPSFGVGPAGFGFNITGTPNDPIVIEATTSLANANWIPLQSLKLTNGAFYFSDPDWTNYPARFYRIRSP